MRQNWIATFVASWVFLNSVVALAADDALGTDESGSCLTVNRLLRMSCGELESIYQNAAMPAVPDGKLRGTVIVAPGSVANPAVSKASRLMWQGKVFDPNCGIAVNKFFGVRIVKGQVSLGESWMDGQPALILDYRQTSRVYAGVRDEIRQIAPGLFLGVMYECERGCCSAKFKMFFVLETPSCCD
jgi:hypothetical protein